MEDQRFPLTPRGSRGMPWACCSETSAAAPFPHRAGKRDAQGMPKHSKATRAGSWPCSDAQPAHRGITKLWTARDRLPAALRQESKAAGIPARPEGTCKACLLQLHIALPSFHHSPLLPRNGFWRFISCLSSFFSVGYPVGAREHVKSCERVTAPGFTGSGQHLPMFMLLEECLRALTWF